MDLFPLSYAFRSIIDFFERIIRFWGKECIKVSCLWHFLITLPIELIGNAIIVQGCHRCRLQCYSWLAWEHDQTLGTLKIWLLLQLPTIEIFGADSAKGSCDTGCYQVRTLRTWSSARYSCWQRSLAHQMSWWIMARHSVPTWDSKQQPRG